MSYPQSSRCAQPRPFTPVESGICGCSQNYFPAFSFLCRSEIRVPGPWDQLQLRIGLVDRSKAFRTTGKVARRCQHSIRNGGSGKGALHFQAIKRQKRVGTLHDLRWMLQRCSQFNGLRLLNCFRQCLIVRFERVWGLPLGSGSCGLSGMLGDRPSEAENGRKYALASDDFCVDLLIKDRSSFHAVAAFGIRHPAPVRTASAIPINSPLGRKARRWPLSSICSGSRAAIVDQWYKTVCIAHRTPLWFR